jgi:uncharacterized protein (DUF2237 family)
VLGSAQIAAHVTQNFQHWSRTTLLIRSESTEKKTQFKIFSRGGAWYLCALRPASARQETK